MSDRILIIASGGPAVREYRIARPARHLGIPHEIADLGKHTRAEDAKNAWHKWFVKNGTDFSLVWTNDYRNEWAAAGDAIREMNGAPIIADVDDHFRDVHTGNQARAAWFGKRKRMYNKLLEEADTVLCSTPWLADHYGGQIAPNFIDSEDWSGPRRAKKRQDEVVICCPAGVGRVGDYAELREPLKRALELPHVKILFVGVMPSWSLGYPVGKVVYSRWIPMEKYGKVLNYYAPDIIVSPMLHNDFNLAKSNLKYLESGAVQAAFMGERWGEYERTVKDNKTGVLASGEDEWTAKLLDLCTNHDKRTNIANAGAKDVAENWTWSAVKSAWEQGVLGDVAITGKLAGRTDRRGRDLAAPGGQLSNAEAVCG